MKVPIVRSLALLAFTLTPFLLRAQPPESPPQDAPAARAAGDASPLPPVAPACVLGNNFESGGVEGWSSTNVSNFSVVHPGSGSGSALYGHDDSGGSTIDAPPGYQGDWIKKLDAAGCSCGEFCFDVLLINDGVTTQPSFHPSFVLSGPSGTYAQFVSNLLITDSHPAGSLSGWHHVCAPIGLNGALPPTGPGGTWNLHPSTASWSGIVTNVTGVHFPVDWGTSLQTEEVAYDNFCLHCGRGQAKPSFTSNKVCVGQPTQLTDTSTNAASWEWSYGGNVFSNQQNPTFTFPSAGVFPVKLCVKPPCGGVPSCVTNPVTVLGPAPFVINGPLYASSGSAIYCASPVQTSPPVTYSWTVSSPATVVPTTPGCAQVTWNGANGGLVSATATTVGPPKCPLSAGLHVKPDSGATKECCGATKLGVTGEKFTPLATPAGAYQLQASLTAGPGLFTQVTAEILSTSVSYPAGSTCGTGGPAESHVLSAGSLGPLASTIPVAGGHEVWWQGGAATLANTPTTVNLQLPPFGGSCPIDRITVCMKYSFTSGSCRTCGLIECYDIPAPVCPECT